MTDNSGTAPEGSAQEESVPDLSPEWKREIEARVEAYLRGELELIPAEEVFEEARRMLE